MFHREFVDVSEFNAPTYCRVRVFSFISDGMLSLRDGHRSQSNRGSTQLHTNAVLEFEERLEAIKVGLSPVSYTHLTLPTKA